MQNNFENKNEQQQQHQQQKTAVRSMVLSPSEQN